MTEIRLEDAKINYEGEWLSAEDLTKKIQDKMNAGDMKIAKLAAVLEELNTAVESSHTLEVKLIISKEDYEKMKELGGGDDGECVRKAIKAYTGSANIPPLVVEAPLISQLPHNHEKGATAQPLCPKCKVPMTVSTHEDHVSFECPECGTGSKLKAKKK